MVFLARVRKYVFEQLEFRRRTTMGDRAFAFAVAVPRAWNSLPDAIPRSPSLAVFKRSLKTHFYIHSFYY